MPRLQKTYCKIKHPAPAGSPSITSLQHYNLGETTNEKPRPITFFKVDVKSIIVPDSIVPDSMGVMTASEYITQLAESIVKSGGELLTPLLVRQTGLEVYELLDCSQYLLLLAVKRAKELSPRRCEMVNVFVISADVEAEAQHQLNLVQGN